MGWFSFKFWFCFRFILASIAHFNWFTAIYVNCIFFTLWKSFDIFWFWFHLVLCICFPALRPENYLIVFFRLILAKHGEYSNKSYKEIYKQIYKYKIGETKAEAELKRVETLKKEKRESRRLKTNLKSNNDSSYSDDENDEFLKPSLYPKLEETEEQAMPNIRLDRQKDNGKIGLSQQEVLITYNDSPTHEKTVWKKFVPQFLIKKSESQKRIERINEENRLNNKDKEKAEKLIARQECKEKKRKEMALLRERASIERRRKNFADSVDLLLTYCRLATSFAVMVGNVHKMFLPRYLAPPRDTIYDSPDIIMVFGFTLMIDVGFFWLLTILSFCQQIGLCCRLGCCRFIVWCFGLVFFGGFCMLYPMHFIHEQLDGTWCQFEEGEPLSEYFDGK